MDFLHTMITQISGNQLFASGIVLALVGAAVAMLRNAPKQVYTLVKNRLSVSVEVRDEQVFAALAEWLSAHRYGARCRRIAASLDRGMNEPAPGSVAPLLIFSPGRGSHIFRHGGKFFWLERLKDDTPGDDMAKHFTREHMMLRSWGSDAEPARAILRSAVEHVQERKRGKSVVYINNGYNSWQECASGEGRPLESVVLRAGLMEEIILDVEAFLHGRERYAALGVPYRRGYGFYGQPGNGKTSIATSVAAHFNLNLYLLTMSNQYMSDDQLTNMVRSTLPRSIILVEDLDAVFVERSASDTARITFSGLLNAVDGVAAQQGRIFIFTTNHLDRIDPALLRPGRIDMLREIGNCDHDQLRRFFLRFFPGKPALATIFADAYADRNLPACQVQQLLMKHRDNPAGALLEAGESTETCNGVHTHA